MVLWVLNFVFGAIFIGVGVYYLGNGDTGAGIATIISGLFQFVIGVFGIMGKTKRDPEKIKMAFSFFVTGAIIQALGDLLAGNLYGLVFGVVINSYLAYVIHQYYQILKGNFSN